jgi:hypothetical protein
MRHSLIDNNAKPFTAEPIKNSAKRNNDNCHQIIEHVSVTHTLSIDILITSKECIGSSQNTALITKSADGRNARCQTANSRANDSTDQFNT